MGGVADIACREHRDRCPGLRHADRANPAGRHRGRGVRLLPDSLDRHQRDLGVPDDRRDRTFRRAAAILQPGERRPANPGHPHRVLVRRVDRGARRVRHPGRGDLGDADGARLQADEGGRARAWSPTPRPSRSAPWPRPSSRWARSPSCPPTRSARWSVGRLRSWRCSYRWPLSRSSTAGAAFGRRGRRPWSAASCSASPSTPRRTSCRCRWPMWLPRCCPPRRWSCWFGSGGHGTPTPKPAAVAGGAADEPSADFAQRVEHADGRHDSRADVVKAYAPVRDHHRGLRRLPDLRGEEACSTRRRSRSNWPGLDVVNADGEPLTLTKFTLNLLTTPGTQMLVAGILTMVALQLSARGH